MAAAMTERPILRAEGVGKRFGGFTALEDVSVAFQTEGLTSIIGPNGAGKSTFFNILSGAFPPSEGRVWFEDTEITRLPQHRFAHLGIAKSFQVTNLFPQLTALENVRVAVQALHSRFNLWSLRERDAELVDKAQGLLELVGLARRRDSVAEYLAHGEQRSLEIAVALACEPRLLLLDEPTAGMSPEEARDMMQLIERLNQDRTVIVVEHRMKLVMGISTRIIVLHHGRLLAEGTPDDIRAHDEVRRVYLGQKI
jgi:branched-chain amino acid transport system ATP-binding protein